MKKRDILNFIVYASCISLIIFTSINASTDSLSNISTVFDSSSAKLYPLKIGDVRVYEYTRNTTLVHDTDIIVTRVMDTTYIGGHKYYAVQSTIISSDAVSTSYYRVDSLNGNLFRNAMDGCSIHGGEVLIDSLAAILNDTIKECGVFDPQNPKYCITVDSVFKFASVVKRKEFKKSNILPVVYLNQYLEIFGLNYSYYFSTGYWTTTKLKGAVLDGVVYGDTATTSIIKTSSNVPTGFSLSQNYPNPFNPSTTITFDIPYYSYVKLTVYDNSGREVTTLVDQDLRSGNYSYTFNAADLTSGVYFYKLSTGEYSDVKKMLLIK